MPDENHSAQADVDDFMAKYSAFKERARALRPVNKAVVFAALADAGVASVIITFDGYGDEGQIDNIEVQGAVTDLPQATICFAFADYNSEEPKHEDIGLHAAVEELAYDCLREHHDGWENNEGAFGELAFDVVKGIITLDFNYRIESTENHTHQF